MSTPTYEQLLKGATTWRNSHMGVDYLLSHHGFRKGDEYEGAQPAPGTWCYYLIIPEQMLPHRWQEFACTRHENGFEHAGPAWEAIDFDSEITWSSSEPYWDRTTARQWDAVKVGCDYVHLWHMERGYPDTFESVKLDAQHTVESFVRSTPDRLLRSQYSGIWAPADEFYTARNGSIVHRSDSVDPKWTGWLPIEGALP